VVIVNLRDDDGWQAAGQARIDATAIDILPFESKYRDDFKRLNVEWLERYSFVEPIGEEVLSDPEEAILESGGFIWVARHDREIVGTAALIHAGDQRFELAKMAVTPCCRRPSM
jgi:hypothetical protein